MICIFFIIFINTNMCSIYNMYCYTLYINKIERKFNNSSDEKKHKN